MITAARRYLGVPFRHRGRNRAGLDCAGLVIATLRDLEALPAAFREELYARTPRKGLVEETLRRFLHEAREPAVGDIVLLAFLDNPCHLAFYAGRTIVHAYEGDKRVVERDFDSRWRRRFVAAYRVV